MQIDAIFCQVCGFKNQVTASRCEACGAKIEAITDDDNVNANAHDEFSWSIALTTTAIFAVAGAILLIVLPKVISAYDPMGMPALMVMILVWFLGGLGVGFTARGKHIVEPVVAVLIVVLPTIGYISMITPEGFDPSFATYAVGGLLGVMSSMFGALMGERFRGKHKMQHAH